MPPSDPDTCACGCGTTLRRSPSQYFATEACQRRWQRAQAGADTTAEGLVADAMTGQAQGVWQAAVRAYRQVLAEEAAYPHPTRYTTAPQHIPEAITYTTPPTRWWSYNDRLMMWTLRECEGPEIRDLYRVTDEAAHQTPPHVIEDYLRRRITGHIPPLPTRWLQ